MTLLQTPDQALISRAQAGDALAFEGLIEKHTPMLYRVVRRLAQDDQETEAVMQEAFWRAWQNLVRYQNNRPFFPYLAAIAVNLLRDRWRTQRWLSDEDLEETADWLPASESQPEEQIIAAEELQALDQAVQSLPKAYQVVITLRYQADLSYEAIAEACSMPINTVRTHLSRARQLLRQRMEVYARSD